MKIKSVTEEILIKFNPALILKRTLSSIEILGLKKYWTTTDLFKRLKNNLIRK